MEIGLVLSNSIKSLIKHILLRAIIFMCVAFMFWPVLTIIWPILVTINFHSSNLLAISFFVILLLVLSYKCLSYLLWRLIIVGDIIIAKERIFQNRAVNVEDITHLVHKGRTFNVALDIYVGERRFARVLSSCINYNELVEYLKENGKQVDVGMGS